MWGYTNSPAGTGDLAIAAANDKNVLGVVFIQETAGAAATVLIRDGASTSGTAVAGATLAANAVTTLWFGEGICCPKGIFLDRTAGETNVTVGWHVA